jgi:hypothetical protein
MPTVTVAAPVVAATVRSGAHGADVTEPFVTVAVYPPGYVAAGVTKVVTAPVPKGEPPGGVVDQVKVNVCIEGSMVSVCGVPATASGYGWTRMEAAAGTRFVPPGGAESEGTSSLENDQKSQGTSAWSRSTDSSARVWLTVVAPHSVLRSAPPAFEDQAIAF